MVANYQFVERRYAVYNGDPERCQDNFEGPVDAPDNSEEEDPDVQVRIFSCNSTFHMLTRIDEWWQWPAEPGEEKILQPVQEVLQVDPIHPTHDNTTLRLRLRRTMEVYVAKLFLRQ
jgi:hypothetical protein